MKRKGLRILAGTIAFLLCLGNVGDLCVYVAEIPYSESDAFEIVDEADGDSDFDVTTPDLSDEEDTFEEFNGDENIGNIFDEDENDGGVSDENENEDFGDGSDNFDDGDGEFHKEDENAEDGMTEADLEDAGITE